MCCKFAGGYTNIGNFFVRVRLSIFQIIGRLVISRKKLTYFPSFYEFCFLKPTSTRMTCRPNVTSMRICVFKITLSDSPLTLLKCVPE